MGRLIAFNFITVNGYNKGPKGDLSWHAHDQEEGREYALEGLRSGNTLLFGRLTYEKMAGYWPTPAAGKNDPLMAEGMNSADKIVFSRTLANAEWNNTRIIKENITEEIKRLKQSPGKDMTILGSGSIIRQFAEKGLIDEYQFMVDPVAIGEGTAVFEGIGNTLKLQLLKTRVFKSGVVLLFYCPVK